MQIGPPGSPATHASDPTVLSDVFARIGGAAVISENTGNTGDTANSSSTLADLTDSN